MLKGKLRGKKEGGKGIAGLTKFFIARLVLLGNDEAILDHVLLKLIEEELDVL